MQEFKIKDGTLQKEVLETLKKYPATRNSDQKLLRHIYVDHIGRERFINMTAPEFLDNLVNNGLPHFESIRRTRQMLQKWAREDKVTKQILPAEEVREYRLEKEQETREQLRID